MKKRVDRGPERFVRLRAIDLPDDRNLAVTLWDAYHERGRGLYAEALTLRLVVSHSVGHPAIETSLKSPLIQTERKCMADQVREVQLLLIGNQTIVHLQKLSVFAGTLGCFGCLGGQRVNRVKRTIAEYRVRDSRSNEIFLDSCVCLPRIASAVRTLRMRTTTSRANAASIRDSWDSFDAKRLAERSSPTRVFSSRCSRSPRIDSWHSSTNC